MLTRCIYATKAERSRSICIKARSPPASLPFKGQVTEQTTVKWSFHQCSRAFRDSGPAIVVEGITNLRNISVRHEKRPRRIFGEFLFHWILLYIGISSVNFGQIESVLHTIQYARVTDQLCGQDTWILAKFFFCVFKLAKKERGQHLAILTAQTWSIKDLLYGFRGHFSCGIQRVVLSGQNGSI